MAHLDLTGGLLPLVAIAGWALAMFVSRRIVARHIAADPELSLKRAEISPAAFRAAGGLWPVRFASDLLHYLVMRGRSAFGRWHIERSSIEDQKTQAEPLVAARIQEASLAARLRNEPLPELPAQTQERVARLTSRI